MGERIDYGPARETRRFKLKIPREEIVFLDMLFKSYEGLALVTVNHGENETVFIDFTEGCREDVLKILKDLQTGMPLEIFEYEEK
ncbi:MAG: DUF4911 domain-containing protein [Halanaerobiaceae bacterium]|nr:DUF4911 domain-containing protein [Halanaerobiaceae bacterium]